MLTFGTVFNWQGPSSSVGQVCCHLRSCGTGGTDVVDLPDILLPEDQYLDMFDSESDVSGDNSEDELVEVL